ncbi:MAG: GyrI-like domain-containing protein [Clostridia bacterium]|nr:GyrI-like domain-containing protein [Clostridia bacterium]
MEYKIIEKAQFSVMGVTRRFNIKTSQAEVPEFWQEHMSSPAVKDIWGTYGICLEDTPDFAYMIADDYAPWKEVPNGAQVKVIPAGTWAVFPCRGALPHSIQDLTKRIYGEWLPYNKEYKKAGCIEIEYYPQPCNNSDEDYCEIWIQVQKI